VVAFAFLRQTETKWKDGRSKARSETEILPLAVLQPTAAGHSIYAAVENDATQPRHRGAVENLLQQFPTYQVLRWGAIQKQLRVTAPRQQLYQCSELMVGTAEPGLATDDFWTEQTVSEKESETTTRISRPFLAVSGLPDQVGGEAASLNRRLSVGARSALRERMQKFAVKAAKQVAREKNFAFEPGPEPRLTYLEFFQLGADRLVVGKVWLRGPEKIFPILLFLRLSREGPGLSDSGAPNPVARPGPQAGSAQTGQGGEPELVASLASEELVQGASGYDFIDVAELKGQWLVFVQYGTTELVEFIILEWRGGRLFEAFRGGGYGC
jgi:hypothetical protein